MYLEIYIISIMSGIYYKINGNGKNHLYINEQ